MAEFQIQHPYHSQGLAAGGSALLDAINRGKVHLAKFILDAGEYDIVNTRDFNGKTPLIRACYIKEEKTRDKAVSLLLRRGADVNLRDDLGRTVCFYACQLRCNDVVQILVKNNIDPDIADNSGNTALIMSSMVGNDVAIEILIRSFRRLGLNVNHVNNDGLTALLVAAKNGFVACASLLAIEGRANLTVKDPETGMTAEQLARDRGCSMADVMTFSVTGNAESCCSKDTVKRSSFWKGRSLRSIRREDEMAKDEDSTVDGVSCSEQTIGKERGDHVSRGREERARWTVGECTIKRAELHQRSLSLPSMRIGCSELIRNLPSSATANPCSLSLGGSRFFAMSSQANPKTSQTEDADGSKSRENARQQATESDATVSDDFSRSIHSRLSNTSNASTTIRSTVSKAVQTTDSSIG